MGSLGRAAETRIRKRKHARGGQRVWKKRIVLLRERARGRVGTNWIGNRMTRCAWPDHVTERTRTRVFFLFLFFVLLYCDFFLKDRATIFDRTGGELHSWQRLSRLIVAKTSRGDRYVFLPRVVDRSAIYPSCLRRVRYFLFLQSCFEKIARVVRRSKATTYETKERNFRIEQCLTVTVNVNFCECN